ncbi:MAG: hypothetical protein ACM3IJ_04265 [Candidatus Levyibacteriota bacterium]
MATVVNNPQPTQTSDNGMGFFLGVVLLLIAVVFLLMYGIPYLRGSSGGSGLTIPSNYNLHINTNK